MDEPDWARILQYLHHHNGEIRRTAPIEDDRPDQEEQRNALHEGLREEIDLENEEDEKIAETYQHLKNTGLVVFENNVDYAGLKLTSDGFDVAHDREMAQRNYGINRALVLFTVFLVLSGLVGPIPGTIRSVRGMLGVLILVGLLVVLYHPNLFPETPY